MKRLVLFILLSFSLSQVCFANETCFNLHIFKNDTREIKSLLNSQVKYANRTNFKKFISTYDKEYLNADGFNLETYSKLVKEIWETYDKIEYGIKIKDIEIENDTATVELLETSYADLYATKDMEGVLRSEADSVYHLKKTDGKWKVVSDEIKTETTSMLYGDARDLDIKLTAPQEIAANTEYTASLEFTPPEGAVVIASIASDKVQYPQPQTEEVFRKFPEDNILERLFTSNTENRNEYVVASIGLTKADICDLSIKLSLTGFGYQITRVNVVPKNSEESDVKDE